MEKIEGLNQEQKAAVEHVEGPLLVIAGAGSGKTRIVTFRIARLLELGVPASDILALTFTNKAADEMRERVRQLCDALVLSCTFHSLCARILRESIQALGYKQNFVIFDEEDSEKVLKEVFATLGVKEERSFLKETRSEISHAKNHLLEPGPTQPIYQLYQNKLKEYNALDFDDLLFLTVRLFREHPEVLERYQKRWSFILIDEYQDTNSAQYMIVKLLAIQHHNVFAVGDPDQSIYSWRGANIQNILNFEEDFPNAKVVSLEQNYRSRNNILQAANALIAHNESRYEKNLWSNRGDGEKIGFFIGHGEHEETAFVLKKLWKHLREGIPLKESVIFYRTNFQSRIFEDALLRERIPYRIIGGISFYQRREIKDILAFLRMVLGGSDALSFARTINLPKRGFGETTFGKLRLFAEEKGLEIFAAAQEALRGAFKLSQKQQQGLREYVEAILLLRQELKQNLPIADLISHTIERLRYLEYLKEDPESFEERRDNIQELISKAVEWQEEQDNPTLSAFLEELSLKSSLDEKAVTDDALRLMTLHNGKGLEFTLVFLVGLEEDLLPHINCKDQPETLEEERRLCYVGMTRAKEYLYLSAARQRFLWGVSRYMQPSRFLMEIPKQFYHNFAGEEEEISEEEEGFSEGDSVVHKEFGTGVIREIYTTSLGLTYDVFFPASKTTRTLIAKYAKLCPAKFQ
jgi:DNA helicase-2/ATP-dependent DNA helicase PcrA